MSLAGPINQTPNRMVFTNLYDGEELLAQFNPTQFTESLGVNWTTLQIPGLSHKPLQFINTDNLKLRFELYFQARSPDELLDIQRARLLLIAWCYPRNVSNDIIGGAAPRLLVTWPGMLSLEAVLRNVDITHQRFNKLGQSVHFTANVQLEEVSEALLTFDTVAEDDAARFGSPLDLEGQE